MLRSSVRFRFLAVYAAALLGLAALCASPAAAQTVRAEASFRAQDGYGRLTLKFSQLADAQVRMSGNVLLISFPQRVDVAVDRVNAGASDWIGAARRDPDGKALRFAVARKVKVNSMIAAEWLVVDLLPENWTAAPPPLPTSIVEELAQRAREADRLAKLQAQAAAKPKPAPVRVRVGQHPTFTRYVFELPELTGVTTERGRDRLVLKFAAPLSFDLADGKLNAPDMVASLTSAKDDDTAEVTFAFSDTVDVRTFREDFNFVVDVASVDVRPKTAEAPQVPAAPPAVAEPPQTRPVTSAEPEAPPAEPPSPPAQARAPAPATPRRVDGPVVAELRRQGDNLRLQFPFAAPTPAAVVQRADTVWLVFDTALPVDTAALDTDVSRTIRSVTREQIDGAQVIRLRLERPRLTSVMADGTGWSVLIGETIQDPPKPLAVARNLVGPGRSSAIIPFDDPRRLIRMQDPDLGDTLYVIAGLGPARGFVKTTDFVEFRTLASAHGVVVQPLADDLTIELSVDKVLVARPAGLTLSDAAQRARRPGLIRAVTFDSRLWTSDRSANFSERQSELFAAAAAAPPERRAAHRLDLARFYMSRDLYAEAKSALDVTVAEDQVTAEDPGALVLRAVANIMLGRYDAALKELANPRIGNQNDAPLWRAIALARLGRWGEAREGFRNVEGALATLPLELQRVALRDSLRTSIEQGDFATATARLNDFETIGVPPELEPAVAVLTGRLAEGLGRKADALASYRFAANSQDRMAASHGRLKLARLRHALGELNKTDTVNELELLTTAWRGDEIEVEALSVLTRFYIEDGRYRDAFRAMRAAESILPDAELTRRMHDDAVAAFERLFLDGKADDLQPVEALSLFYDFRELTPIGRRGDEMIRRLAERLVRVDLLDQAAELLQHQVDNRLQGAARAQVASRLAVVYLLNRKPLKAQAALRATRSSELPNELRTQRLLLEARALSDVGRHDFALEVITEIEDREAIRLRSDIYWAQRHWQQAAEQIELMYGERWRSFDPLNESERSDMLRAAIAYALAEDALGTARLREKYGAKFAEDADRRAFQIVTGGLGTNSAEFRDVARLVASVDTLDGFLRDMRTRYPELGSLAPAKPPEKTGAVVQEHTASADELRLRAAR